MARLFRAAFKVAALFAGGILALISPSAYPQNAPANRVSATPINFDQAVAPLYGPWKFQIGDSPLDPETNEPMWAESGFDDSQWETVNLKPQASIADPFTLESRLDSIRSFIARHCGAFAAPGAEWWLVDRFGARGVIVTSLVGLSACLVGLFFVHPPLWHFYALFTLTGLIGGSPRYRACFRMAKPNRSGSIPGPRIGFQDAIVSIRTTVASSASVAPAEN